MASAPVFQFAYRRSPDQDLGSSRELAHHAVVVVGAGPVGMTLALDLARRGVSCVLLDDSDRIGEGSRAICFAKRTLEIWNRLGIAQPMVDKGVVWSRGRVFLEDREVYSFDLLPEGGHKLPAFINLQQYYVEKHLADAILARPDRIDLRWRNRVTAIERRPDGAVVSIETPHGPYRISCDWLACCDGARSPCREMLGLAFQGEMFEDQFLIADVRMTADFPTERWFWFDPPFHPGQSALLHRQPDDVWRIDLQLSPDADAERERRPESVGPRIERMLGHRRFEIEWVSVYRFQCRRLDRFVHDRVIFAGDAAHQVSPFGARGANSGVQDADNLGWKLATVIAGEAPPALIASYDHERGQAADENIAHSTRSTDFIAPRSRAERELRNAALELAGCADFAKRFVNSGRLSTPTVYASPLSTGDASASPLLGAALPDAPVALPDGSTGWLIDQLGEGFSLLRMPSRDRVEVASEIETVDVGCDVLDPQGLIARRLALAPGGAILVRPDHHVAAVLDGGDRAGLSAALARARAVVA